MSGIGIDIGSGPLHDLQILFRGGTLCGGRFGSRGDFGTCQSALVFHHALGVARAALGGRSVDRHDGRNRALDNLGAVLQTALDDQRARLDLDDLLGVGHLRKAEFLGDLRAHLRGVAVDGLTACEDHVGSDLLQGARKGVRGGQRIRAGEFAARKQVTAVSAAEHRVADDVGGTLRPHRENMDRGTLDAVFQPQGGFQRIEVLGIENGRKRRAVDRPFGGHRVLAHVAGVGHLLGQNKNFEVLLLHIS